jgi:hypothetical protein
VRLQSLAESRLVRFALVPLPYITFLDSLMLEPLGDSRL